MLPNPIIGSILDKDKNPNTIKITGIILFNKLLLISMLLILFLRRIVFLYVCFLTHEN